MDDELLKKISKEGNLHPSNKVMDILRKVVRATKEEDVKICEEIEARARKEWKSNYNQLYQGIEFGAVQCAYSILLSK